MALNNRFLLVLLALAVTGATIDGVRLQRVRTLNAAIENGSILSAGQPLPATALFARAYELERRGDHQAALNLYKELEGENVAMRNAARYNAANIYLRQALAAQNAATPQQMLAFDELAKSAYRDVLRERSGDWDARYNLERALRLVPDPEDTAQLPPPPNRERAVTTLQTVSPGLP
jgi:mxaK protein